MKFTNEEINLLIKGLDTIESSSVMGEMLGEMLIGGLAKDELSREKIRAEREERRRNQQAAQQNNKLKIQVLKGKLAQIALEQEESNPFDAITGGEL